MFFKKNYIIFKNTLDELEEYDIILDSAKKIPKQLYLAQYATGGRLGVILCQM